MQVSIGVLISKLPISPHFVIYSAEVGLWLYKWVYRGPGRKYKNIVSLIVHSAIHFVSNPQAPKKPGKEHEVYVAVEARAIGILCY